jgi:hypothetical protein
MPMLEPFQSLTVDQGMIPGLLLFEILRGAAMVFCCMCTFELLSHRDIRRQIFLVAGICMFAYGMYATVPALF